MVCSDFTRHQLKQTFNIEYIILSGHGGICAKRGVFVLAHSYVRTFARRCLCLKTRAPMSVTVFYPLHPNNSL